MIKEILAVIYKHVEKFILRLSEIRENEGFVEAFLQRYLEIDEVEGVVLNKRGMIVGGIIALILINIVGTIEIQDLYK